jgi:hypothetical protein
MAAGDNAWGPRTSDHRKCRTNPKPKRRIRSPSRAACLARTTDLREGAINVTISHL